MGHGFWWTAGGCSGFLEVGLKAQQIQSYPVVWAATAQQGEAENSCRDGYAAADEEYIATHCYF